MQIDIRNLSVVGTKRCNIRCDHCMRGEPRNEDLNCDALRKLLLEVDYVSTLTLTGGEPFLNQQVLTELAWTVSHTSNVGSIYIATNGTVLTDDMVNQLNYLNGLTELDVQISDTQYHRPYLEDIDIEIDYDGYTTDEGLVNEPPDEDDPEYDEFDWDNEYLMVHDPVDFIRVRFEMFPWASPERGNIKGSLKKRGRAAYFGLKGIEDDDDCRECDSLIAFAKKDEEVEIRAHGTTYAHGDDTLFICQLCLNVNGDLTFNSNISWDDMDKEVIGNILKEDLADILQRFREKNNFLPEQNVV